MLWQVTRGAEHCGASANLWDSLFELSEAKCDGDRYNQSPAYHGKDYGDGRVAGCCYNVSDPITVGDNQSDEEKGLGYEPVKRGR